MEIAKKKQNMIYHLIIMETLTLTIIPTKKHLLITEINGNTTLFQKNQMNSNYPSIGFLFIKESGTKLSEYFGPTPFTISKIHKKLEIKYKIKTTELVQLIMSLKVSEKLDMQVYPKENGKSKFGEFILTIKNKKVIKVEEIPLQNPKILERAIIAERVNSIFFDILESNDY